MPSLYRFFIILGFAGLAFAPQTFAAEVGGWIPYWREEAGIKEVRKHLDVLDSVSPFSVEVQPNGKLSDKLGLGSAPWKAFLRQADREGVDVYLAISWMKGAEIHDALSSATKRARHVADIAALAKKHKVDGIEIDYEGKLAETNPYFSAFLKELNAKLGARKLVCDIEARTPLADRYTVVTPQMAANVSYANDYAKIGTYCDEVRIMAYDQGRAVISLNRAAGTAPYAPVSDVAWVKKVMSSSTTDIAPQKIVMGIPTYGRVYRVDAIGYHQISAINFTDALALAKRQGVAPKRGVGGELTFEYYGYTSGLPGSATPTGLWNRYFVTVSDAESIGAHVALAKALGLKGVALFKFDGTTDPGTWARLR